MEKRYEAQNISNFIAQEWIEYFVSLYKSVAMQIEEIVDDGHALVVSDVPFYPEDKLHFYHDKLGMCCYNYKNNEISIRNHSANFDQKDFIHHKYAKKKIDWFMHVEDRTDEFKDLLTSKFEQIGIGADLFRITLMNERYSFPVHTDGKYLANDGLLRPKHWPHLARSEWYMEEPRQDFAHQGLITLIDEAGIGETVIFKQRFPYSVYYQPNCTVETSFYPNKQTSTILKGDNYQLYGNKILNFTNKPIAQSDYDRIYSLVDDSYKTKYHKDAFYGLEIDKILKWNAPGTLSQWDGRTFHMVKPWTQKGNNLRLALQYETLERSV